MIVYWLERREAELPATDQWLSAGEAGRLSGMRFPKRRDDFRLGRWTAKQAVAAFLGMPDEPAGLAAIDVRAAPSGAPEVFLWGRPAAIAVSIAHRAGVAACALGESGMALGCDLELVEERSAAFIGDYFTPQEQALVCDAGAERSRLATLVWSAKESALKMLGEGLRLDTRCVCVQPGAAPAAKGTWSPMAVRHSSGRVFHGWWLGTGELVRTVVAERPMPAPIRFARDLS